MVASFNTSCTVRYKISPCSVRIRPRVAMEQRHRQAFLKLANLSTDRGLAEVQVSPEGEVVSRLTAWKTAGDPSPSPPRPPAARSPHHSAASARRHGGGGQKLLRVERRLATLPAAVLLAGRPRRHSHRRRKRRTSGRAAGGGDQIPLVIHRHGAFENAGGRITMATNTPRPPGPRPCRHRPPAGAPR